MIEQPTLAIAPETAPLRTDEDGVIRVGNTRVPLDTVIHVFEAGISAEEIVERYPTLALADVYSTIGYYLHHKEEVDGYLQERERVAKELRALVEARQGDSTGLCERLLVRRAKLAVAETG